jgi:hypothetical protein
MQAARPAFKTIVEPNAAAAGNSPMRKSLCFWVEVFECTRLQSPLLKSLLVQCLQQLPARAVRADHLCLGYCLGNPDIRPG